MPSVSIASASGASFNFTAPPSMLRGHEKVPFSSRLIKSHNPVPSQ